MQEARYMISDTAKKVAVEAHVLRYWEEELSLNIARNEMGHRYYTEKDIQVFLNIKKLKEQGFQLKTIKMVLPELESDNVDNIIKRKEELNREAENAFYSQYQAPAPYQHYHMRGNGNDTGTVASSVPMDDKMQQFQMILGNIVAQALHNNNESLSHEIGEQVSDKISKQMNYIVKEQEEREEERYKRLDESIRKLQNSKDKKEKPEKKKKGLFSKKQKNQPEESLA